MKRSPLGMAVLVLFVFLRPAMGQVPTGTPPFGSFGGGPFDVVNLGNLNDHFAIPIVQKAGRGLPFTYTTTYDTSIWYPVGTSGSQVWAHVPQYGWSYTLVPGTVTFQITATYQQPCNPPTDMTLITQNYYSDFVYHASDGTNHPFPSGYATYNPNCANAGSPYPSSAMASDGSGYTLSVGAISPTIVAMNNGTVFNLSAPQSPTIDPNGNQLIQSGGVYTDTLGQTALTITGSNPVKLTYTAPNGNPAAYTLNYTSMNVKTNFGCSGITEYSANSVSLISSIGLPDGTSYGFTYEATPGNTGYTTTRLAEVTLPTGGSISYTYPGAHDGIVCADGSTLGLTRTLSPGGEWQYTRTQVSGAHWQTTVTSPPDPVNSGSASDVTVIDFQQDGSTTLPTQNFYETQRKVYQGAASGTPLSTSLTCYNANYATCVTTGVSSPISQTDHYTQVPNGAGTLTNLTQLVYTPNSPITFATDEKDYGYGVTEGSAPLAAYLVREVQTGAEVFSNSGLENIIPKPTSVTVIDWSTGTSKTVSSTVFTYDQGTVTTTSGTPQHSGYGSPRGNLTTVSTQVSTSRTLYRAFTYYDTGMLKTATDWGTTTAGGPNVTTYNYNNMGTPSPSCGNSFPTSVAYPLSLTVSYTWNCVGGVLLTTTDPNGNTTTTDYTSDPDFWRPDYILDQLLNKTTLNYPSSTVSESALLFNGNASVVDQRNRLDGFGRLILSQAKEGPSSTAYDSTQTDYDFMGRASKTYVPFSNTADADCSGTCPGVTRTYDALNRPLTVTDGGGGAVTYTYTANDVYQSIGPAPTGENAKRKQLEYDGLGRLSSVCEVTSATGSGTCSQTTTKTGFWAKYSYDVLGDMTGITQNAQAASGSQQTRTYTFDMLGRTLSEHNPETGNITYIYDAADSICSSYSSVGDLVEKKDAMGNVTCMKYDVLHRVTQTTYPSGTYASVTPTKCYVYDSATVNSKTMANAKASLAEAYTTTASSCTGTVTVDEGFSYSARGEISDVWEKTPDSGGYYHVNATYWAHGRLNVLNGGTSPLPGLPAITYGASNGSGLDGKGRITDVTAASGQNPVNSVSWNVGNQVTAVTFGSLDNDAYQYDPDTGRTTQYTFNMGTGPLSQTGALTWNANGTLKTMQITDQINTANAQTCTYGHDDLTRIASVSCPSVWAQTFSFDPFGNLSKSGSASFLPTYTGASGAGAPVNKYYQIPGGASGVSNYYDTNGNLKNDQTNTYTWDADGNMLSTNGSTAVTMIYDAMDRMIEQTRSSAHAEIVYGPYGLKMALMSGQTLVNAFVKLPGGARAVYNSSGLAYYRHGDHLGSSRLATTPSRAKYYDVAYAPYGEDYNGSGTTPDLAFTDQNQDTVGGGWGANLYDFMLREYRTGHGRWTSPDPAGLGAVDPTNPQTWNRYAYVLNNPLAMVDLLGDDGCYDSTGQDLGVAEVNCYSAGGVWLGGGQWVGTDGNVYGPPQLVTTQVTPTIVGIPTAPGAPGTYWWTPNFGPFFNLYGFQLITNTFQAPNFPAPSPGSPGGPAAGGGGKPGSVPSGAPPSPKPRTPWQTFIHPTPADCRRVNITAKAEFVFAAGAGATGFLAPVTAPVAEPAALGSTLSGALGEMYMAIVCN